MSSELKHRRSAIFIDEFVDKFTALAISWNGEEKLHLTLGRDSLEVVSEQLMPLPEDPTKATLSSSNTAAYRNDVAGLTLPIEVAEDLAVTILKIVKQSRERNQRISGS